MSAHQGKAIEVLLDVPDGDVPALHGVAVFAVSSKLPAMNVSVAVRALGAGLRKNQVRVALAAGYALVHAAQGKTRFVVVKFRYAADRLPGGEGVAVLAGEIQVAVGAAGRRHGLRRGATGNVRLRLSGYDGPGAI